MENESQKTEKVSAEEKQKFYWKQWADWSKWFETQPEAYEWGEPPQTTWGWPNTKGKGQGTKGESYTKTDPGGLIFEPSAWAQKTNERAPVGNMPLMSEFASYKGWETAARRWKNLLYNHPVSSAIEYFINNLQSSGKILDKGAGGFSKFNFREKMEENEKLLAEEESYEKIGYDWMFRILKDKYKEKPGESIKRLTSQLENANQVIYQELEEGVQDPEGVWCWLSKKRDDLNNLGRNLTNREIYDCFTKCKIVTDYGLFNVI